MAKKIAFFIALIFPGGLFSQQKNIPLNREFLINTEKLILRDTFDVHTGIKPFIESQSIAYKEYHLLNTNTSFHVGKNIIAQKFFRQNLIIINDTDSKFHLTLDPLFNFEFGKDINDTAESVYKNTRGARVTGDIGKDFSFESTFYENQATYINYINDFIKTYGVAPGQGRVKNFKINGYDFAMASGYVSYAPCKYFNLQVGHGKHFIGEGYRSLLLSDNSFNYPYLRITSTFGRFQYTNLYASFINLFNGSTIPSFATERLFQKKAAGFQYLSINLFDRINLGLFQGMIWEANDNKNKHDLNFYYFNPVIFTNIAKYGLNDSRNILIGSTLKAKITKGIELYSQWLIDDAAKGLLKGSLHNKQGLQAGIKIFDAFKIKNLDLQSEYNRVRPFTYAHVSVDQSYTHYNQPLAHPLGANFNEFIAFINYRFRDLYTEIKLSHATIGADSSSYSFGNNVFESDNNAFYGPNSTVNLQNQGNKIDLNYFDLKVGYILNPVTHLNIIAGISNRILGYTGGRQESKYLYLGIRTSLSNVYYDF